MEIKASQSVNLLKFAQSQNINVSESASQDLEEHIKSYVISDRENNPPVYSITTRAQQYQIVNFANPNEEPRYKFGDLTDPNDIEAFLTHQDRLTDEQNDILRKYKPSREFIALLDKMDDETLVKFVTVLNDSFNLDQFFVNNKDKSQELISLMSKMSEQEIKDTVETLAALSNQESNTPRRQNFLLPPKGIGKLQLVAYNETAYFHKLWQQSEVNNMITHQYVDLLSSKRFSEDEMQSINAHLALTDFDQSRGIIDMANNVKRNDRASFLNLLDETDKNNDNNVFTYISSQLEMAEYTSAYQSTQGGHVLFTENMASGSQRRALYSSLIDAYENQGVSWMEDVVEHLKGTPPQIQTNLWEALNKNVENDPALFDTSDSVEVWMERHLATFKRAFEQKQIHQLYDIADDADVPKDIGLLTWVKQTSLL